MSLVIAPFWSIASKDSVIKWEGKKEKTRKLQKCM